MSRWGGLRRYGNGLPRSPAELRALLGVGAELRADGLFRSFREGKPVDASGAPLPWITLPALHWLRGAASPEWRVFEYGAGASTVWLAPRVASMTSVESDAHWAGWVEEECRARQIDNVEVRLRPLDDEVGVDGYVAAISEDDARYDLVIVDGWHRVRCVEAAGHRVVPGGIVLLDDAERERYREAHDRMAAVGFRRVDFVGPKYYVFRSTTTIFIAPP